MRVLRPKNAKKDTTTVTHVVGIGESCVESTGILATHALGSCIAVCLWEERLHLAGLLHFMLPSSEGNTTRKDRPGLYADTGIDLLVGQMQARGADLRLVRARLIGGSSIAGTSAFAVGQRNITAARRRLWSRRITVDAEDVAGQIPRTVRMRTIDGRVLVTSPNRTDLIL